MILALEVVLLDVVPDEVIAAQQVERGGQIAPVDEPFGRKVRQRVDLVVADEILEVAGLCKVDLRGEERRAGDLPGLALGGKNRQCRGQRGAGDAVADGEIGRASCRERVLTGV